MHEEKLVDRATGCSGFDFGAPFEACQSERQALSPACRFRDSLPAKNVGWDGHIGVQFQLDVNATGQEYHEWVDNVSFSGW